MQPGPSSLKMKLGQPDTPVKQQVKQAARAVVLDLGQQYRQAKDGSDTVQQERQMRGLMDRQLASPKCEDSKGQEKEQVIRQQDGAQGDVMVCGEAAAPLGKSCTQKGATEQLSGYVDIPRRIAWERLATQGRKSTSSQVI